MSEEKKLFFGVNATEKMVLDEETNQYIEYKRLSDGELARYEDSVSGQLRMNQETKEASIDTHIGKDRRSLRDVAVVGYRVLTIDETTKEDKYLEGYDKTVWDKLSEVMDSKIANELNNKIMEFNDMKKKDSKKEQKNM